MRQQIRIKKSVVHIGALTVLLSSAPGCNGSSGSVDTHSSVTPPIAVTIEAEKLEATVNQAVTITWSSANATSCTASGAWTGSREVKGSAEVRIPAIGDNTFTLTCTAQGSQSMSQSAVVRGTPMCTHLSTADGVLVETAENLQTAMDRAGGNGINDIIYLAAGIYEPEETIVYDAKGTTESVALVGCSPQDVVIDGQDQIRLFHFQKNGPIMDWQSSSIHLSPYPSLAMSGITVRNGTDANDYNIYGKSGGGALIERYLTELEDMRFVGNKSQSIGGAVAGPSNLVVRDSVFLNNYARQGGSAVSACGMLEIVDSNFEDGSSVEAYSGAAVYRGVCLEADYSLLPVVVTRSMFTNNRTALSIIGGYGLEQGNLGHVEITDSTFQASWRTALDLADAGHLSITRTEFLFNGPQSIDTNPSECVDHDFSCTGGGAILDRTGDGIFAIEDSIFEGNMARDYGGAIDRLGSANCETANPPCDPNVDGLDPEYNIVLRNTVFRDNQSHRGAAISIARSKTKRGFQRGNVSIEGGSFIDNVGRAVVLEEGLVSSDEAETSIVVAGGDVETCDAVFSGNTADRIVLAKGSYTTLSSC